MKIQYFYKLTIIISIIISIIGCASSKIDRQVKRKSKIIRDEKIVICAYKEGIISSLFFNVRENHVFDFYISGMIWDYYSGTWKFDNDTLYLDYFSNHYPNDFTNKVYCDLEKSELVFFHPINDSLKQIRFNCKQISNIDE
ncbi:hypothetical protein ACFLQ5_01155 [Bacteroidota bacterium]